MIEHDAVSRQYVFATTDTGETKFVGDFEGLYKNDSDPWGQSGEDGRLKDYYTWSRSALVAILKELFSEGDKKTVLEIGCGLGYSTDFIRQKAPFLNIRGIDISETAVQKARELHPDNVFAAGDICAPDAAYGQFDCIILNHLLWYILHALPVVFLNISRNLRRGGYLVIQNGFLDDQRYGKEIINGFNGLLKYILDNYFDKFEILKADLSVGDAFPFRGGIICCRKID